MVQLNKQMNKKNEFSSNSLPTAAKKKKNVGCFERESWWFWSLKESVVTGIFLLDGYRY